MRRSILPAGCLLLFLLGTSVGAQEFRAPPAPTEWVTDNTGFLNDSTQRALNDRLRGYERSTGHQVIVWVGADTGGSPLEEWAVRAFQTWGIGKKGKDDGVAVFVFSAERRMRIEVGYGLEGVVPDAVANRIIQEEAIPFLRAGDPNAAVTATVDALLTAIGGETAQPPDSRNRSRHRVEGTLSPVKKILFVILGILVLIFFITHPQLALLLLVQMMSSRSGGGRGGWGGGGGGGFGGGGGRSGGGGASGSW